MRVSVAINALEQKFPGGTVGGDWHIDLALASAPGDVVLDYEGPSPSSDFDLQDGQTYVIRGYRLDAGGGLIGPIATTQYTAGEDTVSIMVAQNISVIPVPPAATKAAAPPTGGKK